MSLETGIAFICLAFLLMVIFIIPSILQIRRVAKKLSETLETLNRSLPEILKNIDEITFNIRQASNTIHVQVEGLALVAGRLQGIMGFILDLEELLRREDEITRLPGPYEILWPSREACRHSFPSIARGDECLKEPGHGENELWT